VNDIDNYTQVLFFVVIEVRNVEGAISLPVPFGDFQLLAGGEWRLKNLRLKVKFTRDSADVYSLKGFSETGKNNRVEK